ncbi:MAG: TRAP transporter substrate-binding protein DctP [Desulfovibrio sp.]|nr:TRAP transporter substrate-binding protein DctP [Desulfovibrio sp.]
MKRLAALCLSLGLFLTLSWAPAQAATLKIATLAPEGVTATQALREAAKEVETATQGRVQIKIYTGGVMGSDAQIMRKLRAGQIHAATLSSGSLAQVDFNFGLLGMPMLVTTPAQADAARAAVEKQLLERMRSHGLYCTGFIEVGFIHIMGNVAVHGPEDMTKAKPWLPEGSRVGQDMFAAFGVTPIPLPLPDVLTGLQTGVIDTVVSSPVATLALQWFTRISRITNEPLLYAYGTLAFADRGLKRLSDADRQVVLDVFTRRMAEVDKGVRAENDNAMQALLAQGIELVEVSPEGRDRFKAKAREVIDGYRDSGELDAHLLQQVRDAVQAVQ